MRPCSLCCQGWASRCRAVPPARVSRHQRRYARATLCAKVAATQVRSAPPTRQLAAPLPLPFCQINHCVSIDWSCIESTCSCMATARGAARSARARARAYAAAAALADRTARASVYGSNSASAAICARSDACPGALVAQRAATRLQRCETDALHDSRRAWLLLRLADARRGAGGERRAAHCQRAPTARTQA